jgi:hypothetical protein
MRDRKRQLDIFICGGSQHVAMLKPLLGTLRRSGRVHLASCFLTRHDLRQLRGLYDVLHTPRHSADGYSNFELFSIRDINRLATAPYFVKLDADVELADEWIDYVDECIADDAEAVLFGPKRGCIDVNVEISGPLPRRLLGNDVRVANAPKVLGGFYVGKTAFFKKQTRFMDIAHEFLWCFNDGVRDRAPVHPEYWPAGADAGVTVNGDIRRFRAPGNEDTLRSLVVHAAGAAVRIVDSGGRVRIIRNNAVHA